MKYNIKSKIQEKCFTRQNSHIFNHKCRITRITRKKRIKLKRKREIFLPFGLLTNSRFL